MYVLYLYCVLGLLCYFSTFVVNGSNENKILLAMERMFILVNNSSRDLIWHLPLSGDALLNVKYFLLSVEC